MATDSWFDASYYLAAKAAALNSASGGTAWTTSSVEAAIRDCGLTPEEHYNLYGWGEGLSPNAYYNENEYLASKVAALNSAQYLGRTDWTVDDFRAMWTGNPFQHYLQYGAFEANVNPSSIFNDDDYYAAKATAMNGAGGGGGGMHWNAAAVEHAFQQSGLCPIAHYMAYGQGEGFYTPGGSTATTKWSINAYMCADNDLEAYGLVDVNEMQAASLSSAITVLYQIDRAQGYSTADGDWTNTCQGIITQAAGASSSSTETTFLPETNMGSVTTLTEFINWTNSTVDAQSSALILWDHGGGISGCCWDEGNGDANLSVQDIATAIETSTAGHLDLVAFDCCEMGILDQAYVLRDDADIMVASEDNIPGNGYDYTSLLDSFSTSDQSVTTLASVMVDTYALSYTESVTLSALDLSKMDNLIAAMRNFDTVWDASGLSDSLLGQAENASLRYDDNIDLYDFMENVADLSSSSTVDDAAGLVLSAVDSMVITSCGGASAHGLTIYMPEDADTSYLSGVGSTLVAATGWSGIYSAVWSA